MGIKCCLGCVAPKRHPGCHDHCPEYIKEKNKYNEERAAAYKKKLIEDGLNTQTFTGITKATKKRKGRKPRWQMN